MDNTEQSKQTPTQGISQVSNENDNIWQRKIIHGVVLLLIVIIVLMMVFSGHRAAKSAPEINSPAPDSQAELQQNEAKLKQQKIQPVTHPARIQMPSQPIYITGTTPTVISPTASREFLARQNAPTVMYSVGTNAISNSKTTQLANANSAASTAIFAGQDDYSNFGNQTTKTTAISATNMPHPQFTIASGEFMHATLETAVNSDLPGIIRAVLAGPVYAYVGERPLIPRGSRLIGQYSSQVFQGMQRVFVVWNRIILPNGVTVQINSPGTDALGQAGMEANSINTHFFSRFGEAALLSIIGAGAATYDVSNQDQYNSAAMYRAAVAQSFQQSANQSLQNNMQTKPTLHIYQGAAINVFVAHDLDFYSVIMKAKQ